LELGLSLSPHGVYRLIEEHHVPGDTVLATPEMFTTGAGGLAREKLGMPYASLWPNVFTFRLLQPVLPPLLRGLEDLVKSLLVKCTQTQRRLRRRYDEVRAQLDLPAERNFVRAVLYSQQLNVGLFPRWFAPGFHRGLSNTLLTDFPLHERDRD